MDSRTKKMTNKFGHVFYRHSRTITKRFYFSGAFSYDFYSFCKGDRTVIKVPTRSKKRLRFVVNIHKGANNGC